MVQPSQGGVRSPAFCLIANITEKEKELNSKTQQAIDAKLNQELQTFPIKPSCYQTIERGSSLEGDSERNQKVVFDHLSQNTYDGWSISDRLDHMSQSTNVKVPPGNLLGFRRSRSLDEGLAPPLKKVVNPPVSQSEKIKLPYLSRILECFFFDDAKAAAELTICIRAYPTEQCVFEELNTLFDKCRAYQEKHKKAKYINRFHDVLARVLIDPKNVDFLHRFFKETKSLNIQIFSKHAIAFLQKINRLDNFTSICSLYTKKDMEDQKIETLFRETSLSSSLGMEFGCYLWKERIKFFDKLIIKKLSQFEPYSLSFDRQRILKELGKEKGFSQWDDNQKDERINQELKAHASSFCEFAQPILEEIYSTDSKKFTKTFAELLQMRRGHIIDFLKKSQGQTKQKPSQSIKEENQLKSNASFIEMAVNSPIEGSKKYTGELLFLRTLNPHFTNELASKEKDPEKRQVIPKLSKVIQKISNEARFENDELSFDKINGLLAEMKPVYDAFLAKYTLPENLVT